jgi:hypothetical protein
MSKQAQTLLAIVILITTVFPQAKAQSDWVLTANVPFEFMIRDKTLPAGKYVLKIERIGGSDAIRIRRADGKINVLVSVRSDDTKLQDPKLVFSHYQHQYRLLEVEGLDSMKQVLVLSRDEAQFLKGANDQSRVVITVKKR